MLTDFWYVGPGCLRSSPVHPPFFWDQHIKPPQEPGIQTKSVQGVDSPPPVWALLATKQVTSLWLLWRRAAPKPAVNCNRQASSCVKVFCSAGLSASWVSCGVGKHFLRNFTAQIHTSEENHWGMETMSSLWRLQSFLWIKHTALADLAPFGKEHFRMLAS